MRHIKKKDAGNLVVVYEPSWAISTARDAHIADPRQVRKSIIQFRRLAGKKIPILYGGNVNSKNAVRFLKEANLQGFLVGQSSLHAKEFVSLVKNAALR